MQTTSPEDRNTALPTLGTMLTARLLVCLLAAAGRAGAGGRVILLVAEGLTEALLATSPTPAMDALAAQGAVASLKPEFPASLVASLQAMVTGQHGDTTGVIDTEVSDGQGGVLTFDKDAEFWQYAPNITTIAVRSPKVLKTIIPLSHLKIH